MNKATKYGLVLAFALLVSTSLAATTGIDAGFSTATDKICETIGSLQKSVFLTLIALVMFIAGAFMIWIKSRGGMALAITGFVGYFLIKQSLNIAKSFGILPSTSACNTAASGG